MYIWKELDSWSDPVNEFDQFRPSWGTELALEFAMSKTFFLK